ncbi:MAG: heavy metal sensor histidine kinase [Pseudomonadota bacterium]
MRARIPNSVTVRTSLLFTLLATGVFVVMGLVIRASVTHHFSEQDRSALEGKLELIRHVLEGRRDPADMAGMRRQLADALVGHHELVVRINGANAQDFFHSGHGDIPQAVMQKAQTATPLPLLTWTNGNVAYRGIVAPVTAGPSREELVVAIATDTSHHQQFLDSFERQLLLAGGIGLALMAVLGWLAARRGLRPVTTMARVAEGISAKRLQDRLEVETVPVELQPLARSFNAMLDRLEDSLRRLSDFSSDLAHELRTPINTLMTQTQVSLSKPRSAEEYQEILYSNLEEFERLARMTADMLFLAKADRGLVVPHSETVDLRAEVEALFEFYDAFAAERGIALVVIGEGMIRGDRLMIRRALSNLLSNAIRHSSQQCCVTVALHAQAESVRVRVENPGTEIPAESLSRLFDRFYRADASRQRSEEGAGLGLAITKSIVDAHRGTISVHSGHGITAFDVELPTQAVVS